VYHERHLDISQNQAPWSEQLTTIISLGESWFSIGWISFLHCSYAKSWPIVLSSLDETMPTSSDLICWRKNLLILLRHLATHNEV
jgi:hypothetical protein